MPPLGPVIIVFDFNRNADRITSNTIISLCAYVLREICKYLYSQEAKLKNMYLYVVCSTIGIICTMGVEVESPRNYIVLYVGM